jgi:hypothetical protein
LELFFERSLRRVARAGLSVVSRVSSLSRMSAAVGRADAALGDAVERSVCAHHRRRLRRVGWESALDARAAFASAHAFPVRAGNRIEVLVDGAAALPWIASASD